MLDQSTITAALRRLADHLQASGVQGEICLLGGTVMVLAYKARPSTKDVDAIFEPTSVIRRLARVVATELKLPDDWINDAAKGFTSARHEVTSQDLPQFPSLRVVAPTARYLLAMKCMAARIAAGPGGADDVADIRYLLNMLAIRRTRDALDIVEHYYPADRVPARTQYLLMEILGDTLDEEQS